MLAIYKSGLTAPAAQRSLNQFGSILHANEDHAMKKLSSVRLMNHMK